MLTATVILCVPGYAASNNVRRQLIGNRRHLVEFARLRESIPGRRAVLFVRHSAWHNPHETFVQNVPDPVSARLLVVYDRGDAENARLLALMPDRRPYLFDEDARRVGRYGNGAAR